MSAHSPFKLAALTLRRFPKHSALVVSGLAVFLAVAISFVRFVRTESRYRSSLLELRADLIAPKGSTIAHLKRVLSLDPGEGAPLLPLNLYDSVKNGSVLKFAGVESMRGIDVDPILFWGISSGVPVISTKDGLGSGVVAGLQAAKSLGLKAGDTIEARTNFGAAAKSELSEKFTITAVADLGRWNRAILSSFETSDAVLRRVDWMQSQIWKEKILSYMIVTGEPATRAALKRVIETRTVASYLELEKELPDLLKFSGIDEKAERRTHLSLALASLVALWALLGSWLPVLRGIGYKLKRSGYHASEIRLIYAWIAALLLVPAALIALLSTHL